MSEPHTNSSSDLLLEEQQGVLHITLNRPDRMNALSSAPGGVRDQLLVALDAADANDAIGCVLLKANGPAFSAGGDLNANAGKQPSPIDHYHFYEQLGGFYASVRGTRKPTVAAVNGLCLGAALGLIVQFDVVVVAENARLGLIEGRIGHPGAAELVPHIGAAWTKFLILTGELISGRRAAEIGLALLAVPEAELLERSASLAERIAALPREGGLLNKATVNSIFDANGAAAGRVVGRAHETLTRAMTHVAKAPDGRRFEEILREEGISGLKRARDLQYKDPWLPRD